MDQDLNKLTPVLNADGSLSIAGTILWLDTFCNSSTNAVTFISSAQQQPYRFKLGKIITTEESSALLGLDLKKRGVLLCQYNRPFSLGPLTIELIPSGSMLGAASLLIERGESKLLYAPSILNQKLPFCRQLQTRTVDSLILSAFEPCIDSHSPSRQREKSRLFDDIKNFVENGKRPIIYCRAQPDAQEILTLLSQSEYRISVHHKIFRINHIYKALDVPLGTYVRHHSKQAKNIVTLLPYNESIATLKETDRPELFVSNQMTSEKSPKNTYTLAGASDRSNIKEFIRTTTATSVYFIGPYAKEYASFFNTIAPHVEALNPLGATPPLF